MRTDRRDRREVPIARRGQVEAQAQPLLARTTNREWLAQFLTIAGQLRRGEDELAEAERMLTEAGRLYEELGLTREVGLCRWAAVKR